MGSSILERQTASREPAKRELLCFKYGDEVHENLDGRYEGGMNRDLTKENNIN